MQLLLFVLAILPWRWGDSHFTYDCELQEAFAHWEHVSGISGECSENPEISFHVVEPWPYGDNILGSTGIILGNDGQIHHARIEVPSTYFLGVLVHEVGHALGLAHSEDQHSTMYRYCCSPINQTDVGNIQSLYGPHIETQTPRLYRLTVPMVGK